MFNECNFVPQNGNFDNIQYCHFVYETALAMHKQPFSHPMFYMHLVENGTGVLKIDGKKYPLERGTLFFTFPWQEHEIISSDNLIYFYISFSGNGVKERFDRVGVSKENFIFSDFGHLNSFWMSAIKRFDYRNANILTESVLMHTLSFIKMEDEEKSDFIEDRFHNIVVYLDTNFTDRDISLKTIADVFFYSEKYLSALFMKRMNVKFTDYLNKLRIEYAINLMAEGEKSLSKIAEKSGYVDQFYFSKVFKKIIGKTPTEYKRTIKNR